MDHRYFKQKLLHDEALNPEEERALREHIRTCTSCAALAEVHLSLKTVKMAAPAPGFANRFAARLAKERAARRNRYFIGSIILFFSSGLFLTWLLYPLFSAITSTPLTFLQSWVDFISSVLTMAQSFTEVGRVVLRVVGDFIPVSALALGLGVVGALGAMWAVSMQTVLKSVHAPVNG